MAVGQEAVKDPVPVAAVLGRAHDPFEAVGGGLLVDFNRRELAGQTVEAAWYIAVR